MLHTTTINHSLKQTSLKIIISINKQTILHKLQLDRSKTPDNTTMHSVLGDPVGAVARLNLLGAKIQFVAYHGWATKKIL